MKEKCMLEGKISDVKPVLESFRCVIQSFIYHPLVEIYFMTTIKIDLKALSIIAEVYCIDPEILFLVVTPRLMINIFRRYYQP